MRCSKVVGAVTGNKYLSYVTLFYVFVFKNYNFILSVSGMLCYTCSSTISLEDCERKQKERNNCMKSDNFTNSCYIAQHHKGNGKKSFSKHCVRTDWCNKKMLCPEDPLMCKVRKPCSY